MWQGDGLRSLPHCRRHICDGAVRHVCTVAVWRKAEARCPQRTPEARQVFIISSPQEHRVGIRYTVNERLLTYEAWQGKKLMCYLALAWASDWAIAATGIA